MTREEELKSLEEELEQYVKAMLKYQYMIQEVKARIQSVINENYEGDMEKNFLKVFAVKYPKLAKSYCFVTNFKGWTVSDLICSSADEIMKKRGIGEKRFEILSKWMKEKGLKFRDQ